VNLTLIASPFNLDQHRQSMGRAPEALLAAGLKEALESDGHTVSVAGRELDLGAGTVLGRIGRNCAILSEAVAEARRAGSLPVVLGGDCLVSIGVVSGLRRTLQADLGVVWFDAHGDFNTPETTISGYLGGMPLACCCGRGLERLRESAGLDRPVDEANVIMVGIRDLDPPERALLGTTPIQILDPLGAPTLTPAPRPTYLHFDVDALDPVLAPGVNFLTPNGLSLETALEAARRVRPHLAALALTAVDPELDRNGQTVQTAIAVVRGVLTG
jgi:arginase